MVQDTLLKYYTTDKEFRDDEHLKAWLLRVAINRAKDYRRANWRRNHFIQREKVICISSKTSDTNSVLDAVASLPEQYRIVIHLHYYEDMPVKHIAELLGVHEGNVKMRLTRARRLLKNRMNEED